MKQNLFRIFIVLLFLSSCQEKYTPKPRGYFRIAFPEKNYLPIEKGYPYTFEVPAYSTIQPDRYHPEEPYWINVAAPEYKAEIHISYYAIQDKGSDKIDLAELVEESYQLAYKHSIKANAIEEQFFMHPEKKVFGTLYRMKGNAASPFQFFLTDSTENFLRGAFYIRETPDIDSLKPVIQFFESDIIHLIETTNWE